MAPLAAIEVTPVRPVTGTGTRPSAVPLLPSRPFEPLPHDITVPLASRAYPASPPPAIATTPVSPLTRTGVALNAVVLLPSSPWPFSPQAHTVPSERNA